MSDDKPQTDMARHSARAIENDDDPEGWRDAVRRPAKHRRAEKPE
jgi:hypothetical protein